LSKFYQLTPAGRIELNLGHETKTIFRLDGTSKLESRGQIYGHDAARSGVDGVWHAGGRRMAHRGEATLHKQEPAWNLGLIPLPFGARTSHLWGKS
jgi:hypothetical protein